MKIFPGDTVRTNYKTGPYLVEEIIEWDTGGFAVKCSKPDEYGDFWLNGFDYVGDRILRVYFVNDDFDWEKRSEPYPDDLDEIFIVKQKEQIELFQ